MEISSDVLQTVKAENKVLRGKIRGYQTLGQLFQELKEKNRLLQLKYEAKETVSIGTETSTSDHTSWIHPFVETKPAILMQNPAENPSDTSELPKVPKVTFTSTQHDFDSEPLQSSTPNESSNNEEIILHLRKNLEDALTTLKEFERKRSNDKKLVKILNDELKKTKDELQVTKDQLQNTKYENELLMKKISSLERERDSISPNLSSETPVVAAKYYEGADDWIHLQHGAVMEESDENEYKIQQLQDKCKQLQEKASKWENEHFNLQMEFTKHGNDLRALLETKSKELIQVGEKANTEKKILEGKFQVLEKMLKEEKEAKFEAYNLHQETIRKYKLLEKKFLTLEENIKTSSPKISDMKEEFSNQTALFPNTVQQKSGLQQQVTLFKEDFEKEKKERILAEKRAKEFEEKLQHIEKQFEKKKRELSEYRSQKTKEASPKPYSAAKISKLPPCWNCVYCTFLNDPQSEECKICKAQKPQKEQMQMMPGWECTYCSTVNNHKSIICNTCRYQKRQTHLSYADDDLTIDGPQAE